MKIQVDNKKILFNKNTMQGLRVWFNSLLKFIFHIIKNLKKDSITKIQIKRLTKIYNLISGFIWQIHLFII